jgi:hypothetical protein
MRMSSTASMTTSSSTSINIAMNMHEHGHENKLNRELNHEQLEPAATTAAPIRSKNGYSKASSGRAIAIETRLFEDLHRETQSRCKPDMALYLSPKRLFKLVLYVLSP